MQLVCLSKGGNPPAQLIWYKNGVQVRMAYRYVGALVGAPVELSAHEQPIKNLSKSSSFISRLFSLQDHGAPVQERVHVHCGGVR